MARRPSPLKRSSLPMNYWNFLAASRPPRVSGSTRPILKCLCLKTAWRRVEERKMNRRVIMMVLGMLWLAPLWAADATEWKELSRDEQKVLQRFESRWEQLPAEQRERLRKGAQRWQQMTPEQRTQAKERFAHWKSLPPEQ